MALATRIHSTMFRGPAGALEGLWKEAVGQRRGSAVFAHPHPLHGGTMHNKVVYRAAAALTRSGFQTLRFQFRGVGLSDGLYDEGHGEVDDVRAALDEAEAHAGLPIVAGGFSFGSAAALRAIVGDPRVAAFIGVGLPVATESGRRVPLPSVPALCVVGERDTFGPPDELARLLKATAQIVVVPGADHFFQGHLESVEAAIREFLDALAPALPQAAGSRAS